MEAKKLNQEPAKCAIHSPAAAALGATAAEEQARRGLRQADPDYAYHLRAISIQTEILT